MTVIDPIAKLHSPGGTLISLYVNRRPPATRAVLVDLAKPLRRVDAKSGRADAARLPDLAERIDSDSAPAVAVFVSGADGIFEYLPLTDPVDEVAVIGPRPHLRPLRARPRPRRAGVLVADSGRARTFLCESGGLHEIGAPLEVEVGKDNFAGHAGYLEPRVRSRAEERSARLWRQAGRRLLDEHQDTPLDLLVIGGHEEAHEGIADQMHPYLQALPSRRVVLDASINPSELAAVVAVQVGDVDRAQQHQLLDALLSEADRGGLAVVGLGPVLDACNLHAVHIMVVAGPFAKEGVLCDGCGWLGRSGVECPVCFRALFPCTDVVAAAMEAAIDAGGKVDVVSVASRLDAAGVGARLRFGFP